MACVCGENTTNTNTTQEKQETMVSFASSHVVVYADATVREVPAQPDGSFYDAFERIESAGSLHSLNDFHDAYEEAEEQPGDLMDTMDWGCVFYGNRGCVYSSSRERSCGGFLTL